MKVTDEMVDAARKVMDKTYADQDVKARDVIEAAIQAAWISVEDRLPEKETPVLVRTTWDEVGIDALRNVGDVYWWRDKDNQNITHWMFLPKYKGE